MNRQEVTANFIEGLEKERILRNLTQAQMAEQLGLSASGYKKIVTGETTKIDLFTAYKLYCLTSKPIFEFCGDTNSSLKLLHKIQDLSPSQINFVNGMIDFERDFRAHIGSKTVDDFITLLIPTGNLEDGMIWDSCNLSKFEASTYRAKFGDLLSCAIQVTTNHLTPVYHYGDILLICKKPPRDGDTGIFINKKSGRAYLRKYRQTTPCRLEPINSFGESFIVDAEDPDQVNEWIKFGYLLTKVR